jgi:low temperature requirement protein LtrA
MARDAFSFAHFPMLCGVIAYAVAVEAAIVHPAAPLGDAERLALALGLFLFVGGLAVALWRASCSIRISRVAVSVVTALAVYLVADLGAWVSLSIAFGGVMAVALLEEHLAERIKAAPSGRR